MSKGRQAKGSKHGTAKLTEEDVLEIRRLLTSNITPKVVAKQYGVCRATISGIKRGYKWKHVKGEKMNGEITRREE